MSESVRIELVKVDWRRSQSDMTETVDADVKVKVKVKVKRRKVRKVVTR
jgi:hypothetical protein